MQVGEAGFDCAVLLVLPVLGGQHTNSQVTLSVSIQTVPAPTADAACAFVVERAIGMRVG